MAIDYRKAKNTERRRGFICLVRQSDASEGTTSTEAQLAWMHAEGERRGLTHVADIVLAGITGSLPGKRDDLKQLLERRDYDVLLVQRCDRLTRGGSDHAAWFHHEAAKAGITVIYPGEDIPEDGSYRGMILAAKFDAAREQARSIGQRSVQGRMLSLKEGRSSVVSRTPYGCDRLYVSKDGDELCIIRSLGDGRQQKLDPETKEVLDTYGVVGGGRKGHYRKQRDDRPVLIPGHEDRVATVNLIFDLHYNENWGGKRIADLLNKQGILSPELKGWSQHQVESIYENPVFCGWAVGRRTTQGIYYAQGKDAPLPLEHDPAVLANARHAPKLNRSPDDWLWEEQPALRGLLPDELAQKALLQIKQLLMERWERSQDPTRPKRSTSKHKSSEYVLTDLLYAKQDGAPLTGVLCGRVGKKKRYYRHRRGRVGYRKGSVYNKLIPAKELEDAVLELIREVISDTPNIRRRTLAAIERELKASAQQPDLDQLIQQRNAIAKRVQLIVKTLDPETLADAQPELDRLAEQRRDLDQQIAQSKTFSRGTSEKPEAFADRVIERLGQVRAGFDGMSSNGKRALLKQFVERVEVDMESKDAEVTLRLPAWALQEGDSVMRLEDSLGSQTGCETHPTLIVPLGTTDCDYDYVPGRRWVCYRCRRLVA